MRPLSTSGGHNSLMEKLKKCGQAEQNGRRVENRLSGWARRLVAQSGTKFIRGHDQQ